MDAELKKNKQIVRSFLREQYSDERLGWLLAHTRDGKLGFMSCCCFIGIPTADHALRAAGQLDGSEHYEAAEKLPGALEAEDAYMRLGINFGRSADYMDAVRRRRLIPIVRAEMRRRERESCPLCSHPLDAEFAVHNECATRENAMAERG